MILIMLNPHEQEWGKLAAQLVLKWCIQFSLTAGFIKANLQSQEILFLKGQK